MQKARLRKIASASLGAMMAVSALAGCGSSGGSASTSSNAANTEATAASTVSTESSTASVTEAAAAAATEDVKSAYPDLTGKTVTMMAWWSGGEQEAGQAKVDLCEKELGVTIDANYIPYDEYLSKLNTLSAAGQMPDVFALPEGNVYQWASEGQVMDLAPAYKDAGIDLDKTYIPQVLFRQGEHVWGVGYDIASLFLYYNKDLFDAAGVEYPSSDASNPWTWDQYVDAAKKLTKDMNGKTPNDDGFDYDNVATYGTLMPTSWVKFVPLLHTNGTGILNDDGTALGFTSPEGIEVFQSIADLSLKEKCAPTAAIAQSAFSDASTMLMNGQVAMQIDGSWAMSSYVNEGFDIGVAAVPMFKEPGDIAWCCGFCVNPNTKDTEAALAVHRWFTDFSNYIDACDQAGLGLGGLPQSYSVYNSEDYIAKWKKLHSEAMVETAQSVFNESTTVLGDNVTVKNFPQIADDVLVPALDNVWSGDETAETAVNSIKDKASSYVDGFWN